METKNKNNIGMFDLAKGFGMILVVLAHTISWYNYDMGVGPFIVIFKALAYGLMSMYFIMSGYGFRPQKPIRCISQQMKFILKPYIIVTIAIFTIFPLIHYYNFRWWPGAMTEAVREGLAFVFGVSCHSGIVIFGYELYDCGSMWFLLALMIAWIILNFIMQVKKVYLQHTLVIICVLSGYFLTKLGVFVYCVQPALITVGFLYVGYLLKKSKLLWRKVPIWLYVVFLVLWGIGVVFGEVNMAYNQYKLGLLDIILTGFAGFVLLKLLLYLNNSKAFIMRGIRVAGRHSLWIISIHTIESICIPWYLFAAKFESNHLLGIVLQLLLRGLLIIVACIFLHYYIIKINRIKRKLKARKEVKISDKK